MTADLPLTTLAPVRLPAQYWHERGPFLARLHETHGPVVPVLLGQTPVTFLLGPQANGVVLQSQRRSFSHRQGWDWYFGRPTDPPGLLTMDEPAHSWHRRVMHPAFAAHRLDEARGLIARLVEGRLSTWAARGEVDVYDEARVIALEAVAAVLLGLQGAADRALCRAVYLYGTHQRDAAFAERLYGLIAERRASPTGDVVGLLAGARDEQGGHFDAAQIRAHVDVLLIAGHETSASLAAWTFYLLLRHPLWERRVVEESVAHEPRATTARGGQGGLTVLDRVLREAERLYPPVPIAPRVVVDEVRVGGYRLPAGTRIFYSAAATHLLPGLWDDPLTFDPDRFAAPRHEHRRHPYALIGFGGGPRICIGRALARLTLSLFVAGAMRRYRLSVAPEQVIAQRPGVTVRPLRGMRLRVAPRH